MKVLNVIMEARLGGPQLRIAEIARTLKQESGVDTTVLMPRQYSGKFIKILEDNGLKYRTMKLHKMSKNYLSLFKWAFFFIPELIRLRRAIREIDPDVVHCNGAWQIKGIIAARLAKKKVVWHLNDVKMHGGIRPLFGLFAGMATGFIYAGGEVRDYYAKHIKNPGERSSDVIYAPVDTAVFDPDKVSPDPAFPPNNRVKIITIANVSPVKGIEYFIEAAHLVTQEHKDVDFYILGDRLKSKQKYIETLDRLIGKYKLDNVYFHGFSDSVPSVLKAVDICVCSSVAEAAPRSVWEAMAMERPVVSTDVGAVKQFVVNGETGYVVPVGDYRGIAAKLNELLAHREKWPIFGKKAREVALAQLDVSIAAWQHADLYRKIAGKDS